MEMLKNISTEKIVIQMSNTGTIRILDVSGIQIFENGPILEWSNIGMVELRQTGRC